MRSFKYLCSHKSHSLKLPCFREWVNDGFCAKHMGSCYLRMSCPQEKETLLAGGASTWDPELGKYRTVTHEELYAQEAREKADQ